MTKRTKGALAGAAAAALLAGGGAAIAGQGDDDANETPITGSALKRAEAAAVDQTGGGRVTGTEVGDEEGYYEVEVTGDDGTQVDVHLDRGFHVLSTEADSDDTGDDD